MVIATADYTMELEIHADVIPGRSAQTSGPPEHWEPGEAPIVEIKDVWILRADGLPSQRLAEVSTPMMEVCALAVLEQSAADHEHLRQEARPYADCKKEFDAFLAGGDETTKKGRS